MVIRLTLVACFRKTSYSTKNSSKKGLVHNLVLIEIRDINHMMQSQANRTDEPILGCCTLHITPWQIIQNKVDCYLDGEHNSGVFLTKLSHYFRRKTSFVHSSFFGAKISRLCVIFLLNFFAGLTLHLSTSPHGGPINNHT